MHRKIILASLVLFFSAKLLASDCEVTFDSTDQMTFTRKTLVISRSCQKFTVKLIHSGSLQKVVMGHNWVLSRKTDASLIASDGWAAGANNNYIKPDDPGVISHAKVIGAGETDVVSFDASKLRPDEKYLFFCSFPGHISMMRGAVTLSN